MHTFMQFVGLEKNAVTHRERLVSALGGFVSIILVFLISRSFLGTDAALPMVASMGASTVLLLALPHSPLAQPWSIIVGHVVSALVGITCAKLVPDPVLAAALAVGLAIGAMHYLHCIHPPGGATALVSVIGGQAVTAAGYGFVLTPVFLNALALVLVAIGFNALFPWRRCPASLQHVAHVHDEARTIRHEDFVYALSQGDTFMDVSEDDLLRIYELATRHSQRH